MKKSRAEANGELIVILSDYLETYPDVRFSQALQNLYYVEQLPITLMTDPHLWQDEFYLESEELLQRVCECAPKKEE